jgi:hypothetical protein
VIDVDSSIRGNFGAWRFLIDIVRGRGRQRLNQTTAFVRAAMRWAIQRPEATAAAFIHDPVLPSDQAMGSSTGDQPHTINLCAIWPCSSS